MTEARNMAALARQAVRAKRARCSHPTIVRARGGREVCRDCSDRFPCGGDSCFHLDCIELGYELGLRKGFPSDYPYGLVVLGKGHSSEDCIMCSVAMDEHFEYNIDQDVPPNRWITAIPIEVRP